MRGFLAAAEMRALAMREEMLSKPGHTLASPPQGRPVSYEERTMERREYEARREELFQRCAEARRNGVDWAIICLRESLSERETPAVKRAVNRRLGATVTREERAVRLSRAMAMRAEGYTWEEIGHALDVSPRERDSLARAAKRKARGA